MIEHNPHLPSIHPAGSIHWSDCKRVCQQHLLVPMAWETPRGFLWIRHVQSYHHPPPQMLGGIPNSKLRQLANCYVTRHTKPEARLFIFWDNLNNKSATAHTHTAPCCGTLSVISDNFRLSQDIIQQNKKALRRYEFGYNMPWYIYKEQNNKIHVT